MSPPIFPSLPGITFPVKRHPVWMGTKQDALSGKRVRTSYFSYPIYQFELTFNFLRSAAAYGEWQILAGFINQLAGSTGLFLYSDPNDSIVTAQSFGAGDGVSTNFQLVRGLGGFVEPVFFPNVITDIKVAGTPTVAYTLPGLGIVSFNSAPAFGAALTWDGTFYWPCRLDLDVFPFDNFMNQLFELKGLKFSSEKLP
jgi:hypothetical protein